VNIFIDTDGGGGPASYRHVRLLVVNTHDGTGTAAAVAELNVLDEDGDAYSRAGWTATADGFFGAGFEASQAIDGNTSTYWHAAGGSPHPHNIDLDMTVSQPVGGFTYLPRQDHPNGRIDDWEFYGSNDGSSWTLLASGSFPSGSTAEETVYPL
jgi:hypothetical protein